VVSASSEAFAPRREPEVTLLADGLPRELEELGLSPYEARVLLALLRLGSGTSVQVATLAKVPRSSSYGVLDELQAKGLVERVPGEGPAIWSSPGRDGVLDRLHAIQEERLQQHQVRTERVREVLLRTIPEGPSAELPFVKVIHDRAAIARAYAHLVRSTEVELLVFNRPPYASGQVDGKPNPAVMEMLARNVPSRVLYQSTEADAADALWHEEIDAYHGAGVQGRVVDHLPLKLAIADRRVAALTLEQPTLSQIGYPTLMHVEHPGFAELQADAFEYMWARARPFRSR
jgi:sugar-specific transcriptional regulator TrmB